MKKKLIVLYEEDKKDPKNTWSGTSYQLRESLKNYYDVIFIDSYDILPLKYLKVLTKIIEKRTACYILKPIYEKLHEIEINLRLQKYKDIPVLEICENVIVKNDFYLYRDMAYACYPYVLNKLKDDDHDYGHGMLNSISKKALEQRIKREEKLHSKASKVFFMGQWVVDLMKEYYPNMSDKFVYTGGGLNNEFIITKKTNKSKDRIKKILFVGIDFKRKGGELLIEAFKLLEEKRKDIKLIIAGSDIKKIDGNIEYVGRLNREELSNLFSKCDIYCMPSRFEAYGLVFIEALCYGLPIIAYNDFEMKYFVEDGKNGYLINNYNKYELYEKIEKVLSSSAIKKNINNQLESNEVEYSWKTVSKRIYSNVSETV